MDDSDCCSTLCLVVLASMHQGFQFTSMSCVCVCVCSVVHNTVNSAALVTLQSDKYHCIVTNVLSIM